LPASILLLDVSWLFVFTVKKSMRQAESNGFTHPLKNEMDEMCAMWR